MQKPDDASQTARSKGRPPSTRAQQAVLAAASELFAARGFSGTSVRDIAMAAGVDAAIVMRHFGSKELLFLDAMSVEEGMRGVIDGPLDQLGRHILRRLVEEASATTTGIYTAMAGTLERQDVTAHIEKAMERHLVQPLLARLSGPDRELRARLVAAQVTGLLLTLNVLGDPVLRATPRPALLDHYAVALQALIDGPAAR